MPQNIFAVSSTLPNHISQNFTRNVVPCSSLWSENEDDSAILCSVVRFVTVNIHQGQWGVQNQRLYLENICTPPEYSFPLVLLHVKITKFVLKSIITFKAYEFLTACRCADVKHICAFRELLALLREQLYICIIFFFLLHHRQSSLTSKSRIWLEVVMWNFLFDWKVLFSHMDNLAGTEIYVL